MGHAAGVHRAGERPWRSLTLTREITLPPAHAPTGRCQNQGIPLPHSVGEMPPKEAEGAPPDYIPPRSVKPPNRSGPETHSKRHHGPQAGGITECCG